RELSGLFGVVPFRGVRLVEREEGSKALWMIPLCLLSELDQFLSGVEDVAPPDQWLCAAMLVMCVCGGLCKHHTISNDVWVYTKPTSKTNIVFSPGIYTFFN